MDSPDDPVERQLAQQGRWDDLVAHQIAQAESAADPRQRIQLLQRAAETYESRLHDTQRALVVWQVAFLEDPRDDRSAGGMQRTARALGCEGAVVADLEGQLTEVPEGDRRAALVKRLAGWHQQLDGDDTAAMLTPPPQPVSPPVARPSAAPRVDPTAPALGELDRAVAGERWTEAVDILQRLAAGEAGELRSKYLATAGQIHHHKLGNDIAALELFNRALDAQPYDLKTFERLYRILARRRAWPEAESNLLRMIARVKNTDQPDKGTTLLALWRRLGDVYRLGLRDLAAAANAYHVCARLAPQDPHYPAVLAQIAERQAKGA
jgi:tetratricopeptide (TPR) repeat protein